VWDKVRCRDVEISSLEERIDSENRQSVPNLIIQRNYEEGIERNEWLPEVGGNERLRRAEKTPDTHPLIYLKDFQRGGVCLGLVLAWASSNQIFNSSVTRMNICLEI
jgi:hypothetical protein